jgi:hypothetical protein
MAAPVRTLAPGESAVTERIASNLHATPTGIALERGARYDLAVIEIEEWQDGHVPCDANGHDIWYLRLARFKRRVPEANWLALMGSIDGEEPFLIGMHQSYTATRSGQLVCFANDAGFAYGNNKGWLRLKVKRL